MAALPIASLNASNVPWAKPAANKPATPPTDPEWSGVKFEVRTDEWRDSPRRHRYVHGCFTPTHLCMSIYLPPEELYRGRFVNHMEGGSAGMDKMMTQRGWDWAFNSAFDDMGAYMVETNEGHWPDEGSGLDNPRELWIANAHGVRYARKVAEEMYGKAPARGYITGCSGGGMRTELGFANATDLFDGAVPQAGHGSATMMGWGPYSQVGMLLGKEGVAKLIDAADVGGSGEIFAGLDSFQREAVRDFLRLGYPRDAISSLREYWGGAAPTMLIKGFEGYYRDFWTKPGFEGHDSPQMLKRLLIEQEVTVERVLSGRDLRSAGPNAAGVGGGRNPDAATYGPAPAGKDILDSKTAVLLKFPSSSKLFLSRATIQSGPDAGKEVYLLPINDEGLVQAYLPKSPWGFDNVQAGDKLKIDNRDYVAYMYQYRHIGEVMGFRDFPELRTAANRHMPELQPLLTTWNQPNYAQVTEGPSTASREMEGRIAPHQRMIYLSGTADEAMWPAYIATHLRKLRNLAGAQADNRFRMWWMESVPHCSGPLTGPGSTQRVNVNGFVSQALVDVMRWAEQGVAPPASSSYKMVENGIVLPSAAAERKGIQPVVKLVANGGARADVSVGQAVTFSGMAEVPAGTGQIVSVDWDFDGKGAWPQKETTVRGTSGTFTATHSYDKPGTYFPVIRVASRRDGITPTTSPVYNIARVRVVVR